MNTDEYNKTVIDYALEFENYEFLKFLTDKKYIWFVGNDKDKCSSENICYGAGTSIKAKSNFNSNELYSKLIDNACEFRTSLITLAIKHNDFKMLNELHAREDAQLCNFCNSPFYLNRVDLHCNENLIEALSTSSNEILEYFSSEFKFKNTYLKESNNVIFPYMNELVNALIKEKHSYTEFVLKNIIKHNEYVYNITEDTINILTSWYKKQFSYMLESKDGIETLKNIFLSETLEFDHSKTRIYCRGYSEKDVGTRSIKGQVLTNIIKLEASSKDLKIQKLIEENNTLYNKIINIKPNFKENENNKY